VRTKRYALVVTVARGTQARMHMLECAESFHHATHTDKKHARGGSYVLSFAAHVDLGLADECNYWQNCGVPLTNANFMGM
jgi:hypothetical protein